MDKNTVAAYYILFLSYILNTKFENISTLYHGYRIERFWAYFIFKI